MFILFAIAVVLIIAAWILCYSELWINLEEKDALEDCGFNSWDDVITKYGKEEG